MQRENGSSGTEGGQLAYRALAEVSRVRILEELRAVGSALDATELAERLGLHSNTVRAHLDVLRRAGLVRADREKRSMPGRPRIVYEPVPGAMPSDQFAGYRLLAHILSSYLAGSSPDPSAAAVEAGQVWGRYLVEGPAPFRKISAEEARRRVIKLLADLGFAPELVQEAEEDQILLHHCPFGDLATSHPEITCSVHLGLMRGALAELGAPLEVRNLQPFVKPSLCVATLARSAS